MIRLIASDLDGTLLNSQKELPRELPEMIRRLEDHGIWFVPVSGRSHIRLREMFGGFYRNGLKCIGANGVFVYDNETRIDTGLFTRDECRRILRVLRTVPGLHTAVLGEKTTWFERDTPAMDARMKEFFGSVTPVDSLEDIIERESAGKISSVDDFGVLTNSFVKAAELADDFYLADAGDNWFDIMPRNIDKGTGLQALCAHLGLTMDEIMIFGDFMNDLPMMRISKNSWCIKNGSDEVKRASGHVTRWTNDENGVIRTIREVIFGEAQECCN